MTTDDTKLTKKKIPYVLCAGHFERIDWIAYNAPNC